MMMSRTVSSGLAALLIGLGVPHAHAAWHDDHPGHDVRAHHVKLKGYGLDNHRLRELMLEQYNACADLNPKLGLPVKPLPATGIPAIIQAFEIDIYYTPGRTITVSHGTHHEINRTDCGIEETKSASLHFLGPDIDTCEVDLVRRKVVKGCGGTANSARAKKLLPQLPPQAQADALRALERIKHHRYAPPSGPVLSRTGTYKVISGMRCEVHRLPAVPDEEKCVAHPESAFPITASPFNLEEPGLLLSVTGKTMTVTDTTIQMDIGLSQSAFAVPTDALSKDKAR